MDKLKNSTLQQVEDTITTTDDREMPLIHQQDIKNHQESVHSKEITTGTQFQGFGDKISKKRKMVEMSQPEYIDKHNSWNQLNNQNSKKRKLEIPFQESMQAKNMQKNIFLQPGQINRKTHQKHGTKIINENNALSHQWTL